MRPLGSRSSIADFYHRFLRASWWQLGAWFAITFTTFNVLFAGLYTLDPKGISWGTGLTDAPHFWRAFFFSVDTVATVGYGNMFPVSIYANTLVVIEITLGILFFALVTGIMFARFSRPTARVLFSEVAVVSEIDGIPTLMFRAANQRHNMIYEAKANVSVLSDELVNGSTMRRFHDLRLVREANPVFALTWMIMHPIDEHSPLARWTSGEVPTHSEIIVVISGTDDRTGQTIYGRWAYAPSDIRWNAAFADILGQTPDGTRTIDYRLFHEVELIEPH